jgi:hypothetical protein
MTERYRTLSATLIILLSTLVLPLFLPNAANAAEDKVTICHLPPGNPQNRQTIVVGSSAVAAHLKHGDSLGACPSGCQLNANACDDGNLCTTDVCLSDGTCSHKAVSCDDGNICTLDACDPQLGCTYTPVSASNRSPCNDGNACTNPDICANGTCSGTPVAGCCNTGADCSDNNACTDDTCTGNVCQNTPKTCTSDNKCLAAYCDPQTGGCATTPVACDDSNICTDDSCDPATGCVHTATQNPPEPGREVSCSDGLDNDCDGLVDAADPDCQQQCTCPHCLAASPDASGACVIVACESGWASCDGAFANGCETNLTTDANHCGTCSNVCTSNQACSNGQCINVGQCAPGLPVTHSNGLGQTWTDCVPLNTYNQTQAIEACVASTGNPISCAEFLCGSTTVPNVVCSSTSCWAYLGSTQGRVSTSGQSCPTLADPSWN